MKRIVIMLLFATATTTLYAQNPGKSLAEAQIEYDRAKDNQKRALNEIRSEERRITDAANDRLDAAKSDLEDVKEEYKAILEEQKRRVAEAKRELDNANARYKQEATRTKQEIASAKSRTKAVEEEH